MSDKARAYFISKMENMTDTGSGIFPTELENSSYQMTATFLELSGTDLYMGLEKLTLLMVILTLGCLTEASCMVMVYTMTNTITFGHMAYLR